ncbi:MAG TPA: rod shape-determining protein MreC, partial [Patescibacteria group bacterium]|nr:rod shape-determining protein MreC [Patescibacteria group bacterium]
FLNEHSFRAITARVTSRSTEHISEGIVINKGSKDGLQPGLPAIVKNGIIIGVIQEVQDYSSEILLITSASSQLNGSIQNESHSPGIIQGAYNLSVQMNFIPQSDALSADQFVFTNGLDPFIPEGLVIGQIKQISNEPGSLFQQASVAPLFQPFEISILSILLP